MPKKIKRGPGRPRRQAISGEALRERALAGIQRSTERRAEEDQQALPPPPNVEDVIIEATAVTRKHKYTSEQMEELKDKLDFIYQRYMQEKWEEEAAINEDLNKRLHKAALNSAPLSEGTEMMSPEDWFANHGLRPDGSKKRGPAPKRKKFFWEVTPGDKGTSTEPSEPIDADAIEAQLLEEYIQHERNQPQMLKGKRVRGNNRDTKPQRKAKSFWI